MVDPKGPKEVPKGPMVNPEGPKEDPKRPQGGPWGALVSLQQIARFATARFGDQKGFKGHQTISVRRDLENTSGTTLWVIGGPEIPGYQLISIKGLQGDQNGHQNRARGPECNDIGLL